MSSRAERSGVERSQTLFDKRFLGYARNDIDLDVISTGAERSQPLFDKRFLDYARNDIDLDVISTGAKRSGEISTVV